MMCYQMKAETEQLNLRADKALVEKLQKLSDKFNRRSKAQVAVEIIEQYLDFWEQAEAIKFRAVQDQRIAVNKALGSGNGKEIAARGKDKMTAQKDEPVVEETGKKKRTG